MAIFPPIYVINLKRNPERRLHIQRQLDAFGLKYEFVDVDDIDKHELKSQEYRVQIAQSLGIDESLIENKYAAIVDHAKTKQDKNWKNANLGSLAVALSHIKIYDLMIKNGIDWACILEDDATLLPTFPEVLKIAPELEWDILLLASQPTKYFPVPYLGIKGSTKNLLSKYLLLLDRLVNSFSTKQRAYQIKRLSEDYGIDFHLYPKQLERVLKVCEEYNIRYKEIVKKVVLEKLRSPWINFSYCERMHRELHEVLELYTIIQLGVWPEKSSLQPLTEHHRVAKPKYEPYSTIGYLVNQFTAVKWKRKVLDPSVLAIDQTPWELYKNEQVKLRIVTPPCATATYEYLRFSARRR